MPFKVEVKTERIALDFKKLSEDLGLSIGTLIRSVALDSFKFITKETPVDTGRAKASWNIGINTIDFSVQPETFSGGRPEADQIADGKADELAGFEIKDQDVVNISNNLEYIRYLNDGTSDQAPKRFIQTAVQRAVDKAKGAREA